MSVKLQVVYHLHVPPEVLDDVEQKYGDRMTAEFINPLDYPKLNKWLAAHSYIYHEGIIVMSDGENQ
jgi:hypothetical protein